MVSTYNFKCLYNTKRVTSKIVEIYRLIGSIRMVFRLFRSHDNEKEISFLFKLTL
jgi:hypothetical protein